jgi:hypothetical protein
MTYEELMQRFPDGKDERGRTVWTAAPSSHVEPETAIDQLIEELQANAEFFGRTFNKPELVTYYYGDGSGDKGLVILPRGEMPRQLNVAVFGNAPADRTQEEG